MVISTILRVLNGPRILRIYNSIESDSVRPSYLPNALETCGDHIIRTISVAWSMTFYTSPVILSILYRKGYFCAEGCLSLIKFASAITVLLLGTVFIRGIGRFANPHYMSFLDVLEAARNNLTRSNKIVLSQYDFDFGSWPVEYYWNGTQAEGTKRRHYETHVSRRSVAEKIKAFPCHILSYIAIHTLGKRMIYPGTVSLLQAAAGPLLLDGRQKLVQEDRGERFKLRTEDGNDIDSMFVDRRNSTVFANGNALVICCEGNAGFYENGIMVTPLKEGYSVLGWNHPGFAGSTGVPFPNQEKAAMDVVIQFAINKLGFPLENVLLFAWSIGAYSATWGAMTYPDIRGLILDATFDDLLPLAIPRMPTSWKPLVVGTIREHMNLNNIEHLTRYQGPILLIRRTHDEIISTNEASPVQTNRGNALLIKLLQHRYPNLMTDETVGHLQEWLAGDGNHQINVMNNLGVEDAVCQTTLKSYIEGNSASFPMLIGDDMSAEEKAQMVLYLAHKYMDNYDSTHCTPLPGQHFQIPWDPASLLETAVEDDRLSGSSEISKASKL